MKQAALIFTFIVSANLFFGQNIPKEYFQLLKIADSLYNVKDYIHSAHKYSDAFKANGGKGLPNDRYNAACCWALAGVADSAFFQLNRIATQSNYTDYEHISTDPDLSLLHNDSRWKPLLAKIKQNKDKAEANYYKPLQAKLLAIYNDDQPIRQQFISAQNEFGYQSKQVDSLGRIMMYKDSINLIKVTEILDKYGWVGTDKVGGQANQTLFLVIQHADLKTQQKYLPMMREAVKNKNAKASALALLEDRVALGEGRRQIYGSQIDYDKETNTSFVSPLEDPDNVDKRRAAVGLGLLSDYVKDWGIIWNVEEYKKLLPEIEAKQAKKK